MGENTRHARPVHSRMTTSQSVASVTVGAVHRLVPFAHVAEVDASLAFYALLGFAPVNVLKDARGVAFWAMAKSNGAEIMFTAPMGRWTRQSRRSCSICTVMTWRL